MIANELRIGNWVANDKGEYGTVAEISSEGCWIQFSPGTFPTPSDINPIPLTEEILLKCGFKQGDNILTNDHFYQHPIGGSVLTINPDNGVVWIYRNETIFNNPALICHLHQLQNLYFALTGTELTYTP